MDILGIGNALLDIFWFSDAESALQLGLHPNSSTHVGAERLDELLLAIPDPVLVSGGSAGNALKAAAALGAGCTLIGCTGTADREPDRWANAFRGELESFGIDCRIEPRTVPTGRCLVIHMPGGMKSVACSPSAATALRADQIDPELVAAAGVVLLDGQTLRNAEVTARVASLCRESRIPIAVDVASVDIARHHAPMLLELLVRNDCILLANSEEALALAISLENQVPGDRGFQSSDDFIDSVFGFFTSRKQAFPCIVEKQGEKGARGWHSGNRYDASGTPVRFPLDDTAAGDIFTGALLRAWLRKLPLPTALAFANGAAAASLDSPGSRIDAEVFRRLSGELDLLAPVPSAGDRTGD
jgi:Sugar kinases, ribokinase family